MAGILLPKNHIWMCGITGMTYFNRDRKIDKDIIKKMSNSIYHRGPDDEGQYINENIGFGFRRLSIIGLTNGHQPMTNQDKSICIVFNGEIYNYIEQRKLLKQKGYTFITDSDTEVILYLYEEYGENCLSFLRGMFAFSIWDNNKNQLFCARDRFGIKPFYYYIDDEKFVFGSEIKAILQCSNIDRTISMEALDSYFAFGYITSDLSIYKKIKKLPPAHSLTLKLSPHPSFKLNQYWEIIFNPDFSKSEDYWADAVEESFAESVKLHMVSDVPLGAFLSGGIDSSSVVAMMAKHSPQPVKTFSIGFKEQEFNELQYAREIAKKYGCEYHEEIIEPQSISLLPKLVSAYDEPFADASAIPTYYVSELARKHVKVALSGDGGDELFAGYNGYNKFKSLNAFPLSFNNAKINKLVWGGIHKIIPQSIKGKGLMYFLSQDKTYAYAYQASWTPDERMKLLQNGNKDIVMNYAELFKRKIMEHNSKHDFITNLQYLDLQTYMVDDVLTKVDRASMMNSLEVRVPFLDHKFAELSFKIPWDLKFKKHDKKYILKKAMTKFLPDNIMNHPKQGFGVPLSLWFKNDLKEYVNDKLLSSTSNLGSFIDVSYVKKIVDSHSKGGRDFNSKIWSLLFYEEWFKQNG